MFKFFKKRNINEDEIEFIEDVMIGKYYVRRGEYPKQELSKLIEKLCIMSEKGGTHYKLKEYDQGPPSKYCCIDIFKKHSQEEIKNRRIKALEKELNKLKNEKES